jgi:phage-related protein
MYRSLEFFEKTNGTCPVEDFLKTLDVKTHQKAMAVFELIETLKLIPKKFFKKLVGTDDLWEIRIEFKSNIYRFLCVLHKGHLVVLTHGFQKKTDKTPTGEIKLAEQYKKEYLERMQQK